MNKLFKALLGGCAVALQLYAQAGLAAWVAKPLATTLNVTSTPSCAPLAGGQAICGMRGDSSNFLINRYNGTSWVGFQTIGGPVHGAGPICVEDGLGKAVCVTTASTGRLWYTVFNGTTWAAFAPIDAVLVTDAPSCASFAAGKVVCVARNSAGGLASRVWNGIAWSAATNLAGATTSAPSCTADGAGGAVCAVLTAANHSLVVYRYNGVSWSTGLNIAGEASSAPTCTKMGLPGQVACFARGRDSALWGRRFIGGTWTVANWQPWGSLGGVVFGDASCTSTGAGLLTCGVIATLDSAIWTNQFNGTNWLGWVKASTATALRGPSCTGLTTGKALCTFVTIPNKGSATFGP